MNLPVSTAMMLAVLTALRVLCFITMALFLMLAIRAQFDESIAVGWGLATALAAVSWLGAAGCGIARKALLARMKQG